MLVSSPSMPSCSQLRKKRTFGGTQFPQSEAASTSLFSLPSLHIVRTNIKICRYPPAASRCPPAHLHGAGPGRANQEEMASERLLNLEKSSCLKPTSQKKRLTIL